MVGSFTDLAGGLFDEDHCNNQQRWLVADTDPEPLNSFVWKCTGAVAYYFFTLYCIIVYYVLFYSIILYLAHHISLHYIVFYYAILFIIVSYIISCYIVSFYVISYYIITHYIVLYCILFYSLLFYLILHVYYTVFYDIVALGWGRGTRVRNLLCLLCLFSRLGGRFSVIAVTTTATLIISTPINEYHG